MQSMLHAGNGNLLMAQTNGALIAYVLSCSSPKCKCINATYLIFPHSSSCVVVEDPRLLRWYNNVDHSEIFLQPMAHKNTAAIHQVAQLQIGDLGRH